MIAASLPSATRTGGFARWFSSLIGVLCPRSSVSWVEEPQALAYPPSARARRLMRGARCGGW